MNFRKHRREEPEINLIPFIDVLLVIIIFLMLTTTYSRFTELKLNLPSANAEAMAEYPKQLVISVAADGRYAVGGAVLNDRSEESLMAAMRAANLAPETALVISADALASHQAVITVMQAAHQLGQYRITFATQKASSQ